MDKSRVGGEQNLVEQVAALQLDEFQHENVIRAKKRPFTNSAQMSAFPPLYLEANIPSLSGIMRARFLSKQFFSEPEVINMFEGVIYGLAYLESRGMVFGDVHPNNIFYDQLRNCYKIGNPYFTEPGLKQVREGKRMSFLSPEQITSIYDSSYKLTPAQSFKSDVFTLGMHLLEVCNLDSAEPCYNNEMRILDFQIQKRLQLVGARYSPQLTNAIMTCLDYNLDSRPGPLQLSLSYFEQFGARI